MSYYDRKYRDMDLSFEKAPHSTPMKNKNEDGRAVSSHFIPGQISTTTQNNLSGFHNDENVFIKSGITQNVTQSVKKSVVSSRKSSGYSSEEGRKEEDIGSTDMLNPRKSSRIGSSMDVESYGASSSTDERFQLVDRSKPTDLGFQYEDIQSFKERQKVEGDRLQMHRKSLTGNIVGTGKHGMMKSEYTRSHESKPNENDVSSSYSSQISHYKSSSENAPSSREPLLAEIRGRGKDLSGFPSGSKASVVSIASQVEHLSTDKHVPDVRNEGSYPLHANSSSSQGSKYSSRSPNSGQDITVYSGDSLLTHEDSTDSALFSSRYISEALRSRAREDIFSSYRKSNPLLQDAVLSEDLSNRSESDFSGLTSSKEAVISSNQHNNSTARESLLVEGQNKGTDSQSSFHYSRDLSKSKQHIIGDSPNTQLSSSGLSGSDSRLHDKQLKQELPVPKEDRFSKSDALVAKYLQSSRDKGLSKHGSESDLNVTSRLPPPSGIMKETRDYNVNQGGSSKDTEVVHHSVGRPMSYLASSSSYEDLLERKRESVTSSKPVEDSHDNALTSKLNRDADRTTHSSSDVTRRLNTELRDERKARQEAIDRLLKNTRQYSSENILDRKLHDKSIDDDLGAVKSKGLVPSGNLNREERCADSYSGAKTNEEASGMRLKERGSQKVGDADQDGLAKDFSDRTRPTDSYDTEATGHGVVPQANRIDRYNNSVYETPYTSLDHSYKPTRPRPYPGKDDEPIYDQPLTPGTSSHIGGLGRGKVPGHDTNPPDDRPQEIFDKLSRGSNQPNKPSYGRNNIGTADPDNRRGPTEAEPEPIYDHLNTSGLRPSRRLGSPVPISDKCSLPIDKYDKPVAVHGGSQDPNRADISRGGDNRSSYPNPRDFGLSEYGADQRSSVTGTTRTSYMERTFVSRNGEVLKDETRHHEEVRHSGRDGIEESGRHESSPDLPTRIQRYPPAKAEHVPSDQSPSNYTEHHKNKDNPELDDILRKAGIDIKDTGKTTNFQEYSRKDEITRIRDDSNMRTKVNRSDVRTNVNVVKEVVMERKEKPKEKPAKSGIAGLRAKIEALTKSVDDLMAYKHETTLKSYVQEHGNRRPSKDFEAFPKPEYYEVKSKRYEPDIKLDDVDYAHKEVEIVESPQKAEVQHEELNLEDMWVTTDQQGLDIGLRIPKQINLSWENNEKDWWNAPTAEDADRFLCIGDWQWWNANTTEGVDHILGVRAINKETGAAGAIIAKYQGDEKPIEWAWLQAPQQPSSAQKRRTLTRVFQSNQETPEDLRNAPTAEDADQHLSIGNYKWWDENKSEGVEKVLGVQGSSDETGTILATYEGGTKPTAWTWVQTSHQPPDGEGKRHTITRSSRDVYIDETNTGNVELLVRVKDEETTTHQQPRYLAIRPGPIEKAIIIREIVESDIPPYASDVTVEGKSGEGLEIQDGVVKMRIKDMTPEARKAWVDIMGIEKKNFKLKDNETLEIPVKVVDRPKPKEDIYAVPMKTKKKKSKKAAPEKDAVPTIPLRGELTTEKKKESKTKESEKERKKQEQKAKKLEEKKRKEEKESIKKKAKQNESEKKKKEMESIKKKKEAEIAKKNESQKKKKKEVEKLKQRESEKRKKEQLVKKSSVSSSKEKLSEEKIGPPPVDRSLKPKQNPQEFSERRRSSGDLIDGGQVSPGADSTVRKPGPFALSHKPQSTKGRINNVNNQVKSARSVIGSRKSGGGQIAVPLRGGVKSTEGNGYTAFQHKRVQSERVPGQRIKQTIVEKTHKTYRTGTEVIDPSNTVNPVHHHLPLKGSLSDSQAKVHMIRGSGADPINSAPVLKQTERHVVEKRVFNRRSSGDPLNNVQHQETHVVENRVLDRRASEEPFNTVPAVRHNKEESQLMEGRGLARRFSAELLDKAPLERRGSGHSVTNLSITSRASEKQPSAAKILRRTSADKVVPLERRGSGYSVTNLSVTTNQSREGQPNVVQLSRRSSDEKIVENPIERRGSDHSVTNISVTTNTAEGLSSTQAHRQSSVASKDLVPVERRGSSHAVHNLSVTSRTIPEVQPTLQTVIPPDNSQGADIDRMRHRVSGDPWKLDKDLAATSKDEHPTTSYFREEMQTPHGYMKREIIKKTAWSEQQRLPNKQ